MVYYMLSFAFVAIEVWCALYFLDTFLKKKEAGKLEKFRFIIYFVAMVIPAALSKMMSFGKIFVFMSIFVFSSRIGLYGFPCYILPAEYFG